MLISSFHHIEIAGISAAVPTRQVPVEAYIEAFGEEAVAKFSKMTGVKSVYRSVSEQTASDLGYEAARNLIHKTGCNTDDLGILVFVTQKPDYRSPSTACVLHKRLGMQKDCSVFDVNMGCSGYVYGLQLVFSMLNSSDVTGALLITGDTSTRTMSPYDRSTIMLFGDGATATLIKKTSQDNPAYISLRTDGNGYQAIITLAGAFRNIDAPKKRVMWSDGNFRSEHDTYINGVDVFNFTISEVPKLMQEFMDYLGTDPGVYDIFALHQANTYILKQLSRKLKIPMEKIHITMDRYGNTSSNSIPLVLVDAYGEQEKQRVRTFLSGFGIGLSWGCVDISLAVDQIYPVIYSDEFYAGGGVRHA